MIPDEVNKYIDEAYGRLLDYCKYHCNVQHLYGLEYDLLNHVLMRILERVEKQDGYRKKVVDMLGSKNGKWTDFDYHVLSIIKFNAESDTAPFKRQYDLFRPLGTFVDVDFQSVQMMDDYDAIIESEREYKEKEKRFNEASDLFGLTDEARDIFRWRYIDGKSLSDYPYAGDKKKVYDICAGVMRLIKEKLNNELLF